MRDHAGRSAERNGNGNGAVSHETNGNITANPVRAKKFDRWSGTVSYKARQPVTAATAATTTSASTSKNGLIHGLAASATVVTPKSPHSARRSDHSRTSTPRGSASQSGAATQRAHSATSSATQTTASGAKHARYVGFFAQTLFYYVMVYSSFSMS